jgi:hypothetical protein
MTGLHGLKLDWGILMAFSGLSKRIAVLLDEQQTKPISFNRNAVVLNGSRQFVCLRPDSRDTGILGWSIQKDTGTLRAGEDVRSPPRGISRPAPRALHTLVVSRSKN